MATDETRPPYAELAAEAWADRVAMFILHKIVDADEALTLSEIAPNLTVPHGWIALAKLWRADYIDVMGEFVQPTEAGIAAMRELAARLPPG
jgi:hypothetical protein